MGGSDGRTPRLPPRGEIGKGTQNRTQAVQPVLSEVLALEPFRRKVLAKLCGNYLIASAIEALSESLALAEGHGLGHGNESPAHTAAPGPPGPS